MLFFGRNWALLVAMLAFFGQLSPLAARVCSMASCDFAQSEKRLQCAPENLDSVAVSCCHRAPSESFSEALPACCASDSTPLAMLTSAPLLASSPLKMDAPPGVATLPLPAPFGEMAPRETTVVFAQLDLPPPLLGSLSTFSYRAPPAKI